MFVLRNESLSTLYDRAVKWHPAIRAVTGGLLELVSLLTTFYHEFAVAIRKMPSILGRVFPCQTQRTEVFAI